MVIIGLDPSGGALDVYDLTDALLVKPATSPADSLPPVFLQGTHSQLYHFAAALLTSV